MGRALHDAVIPRVRTPDPEYDAIFADSDQLRKLGSVSQILTDIECRNQGVTGRAHRWSFSARDFRRDTR